MEIIKKNAKHQNISPNKKLLVQVSYKTNNVGNYTGGSAPVTLALQNSKKLPCQLPYSFEIKN